MPNFVWLTKLSSLSYLKRAKNINEMYISEIHVELDLSCGVERTNEPFSEKNAKIPFIVQLTIVVVGKKISLFIQTHF